MAVTQSREAVSDSSVVGMNFALHENLPDKTAHALDNDLLTLAMRLLSNSYRLARDFQVVPLAHASRSSKSPAIC